MGGNTASLILKADSRGIRKGTDDLRKIDRQAGATERTTNSLNKSFSRMGKVAGVAALAVGAIFTRAVIKNTIAQQNAVAQLNASLKSTGRFTEEASKALRDHAAALQQVSTFGDESIIVLQSQLLTFKQLGGEVLPRATEAALDLSVKMGGDLKAAAKQLGLALNDPITGLSRLSLQGISFSEAQKEVIRGLVQTNQLAKAQGLILEEIESEFGGAARAARDTFGGALKAVANNLGDLLEVSGDDSSGVVGSLNDLAKVLSDPDVRDGFQTLASGVLDFISALAQVPAFAGFIQDELAALFGRIDPDDLVRLDDRLANLNKQLQQNAKAASTVTRRPGDFFAGEEARLKIEIASINNLIKFRERVRAAADKRPTVKGAAAAVAGSVDVVDSEEEAPLTPEQIKALTAAERASDNLRNTLIELENQLGGPSVVAANTFNAAIKGIEESENALREAGQLTQAKQAEIDSAKEQALLVRQQTIALIDEERRALNDGLTPAEELIASLELELELMGLSNIERQKRIALIQAGTDATEEEKAAIIASIEALNANDDVIVLMDSFRDASIEALSAFADGSRSAGDAFDHFMDTMKSRILQMLASKLIEKLFGSFGSSSFGGFLSSIFGPGRASGGAVTGGKIHPVNELGQPELLNVGNKQFLLPTPAGGNVVPLHPGGGGSVVVNIDARQNDNPAAILSLIPIIQQQVERSIALKRRRGIA